MIIRFAGLFLIAGLFLLSACGQKGPLYLENEPAPVAAAAEPGEEAAADKTQENADKEKDVKPETKD